MENTESAEVVPVVSSLSLVTPYFPNKLHKQELLTYNKAA